MNEPSNISPTTSTSITNENQRLAVHAEHHKNFKLATEIFQRQVEEKVKLNDNPLPKEGTPTGQFFCTHTIRKRDLRRLPKTLKTHKIVVKRLNTVIADQVTRKLGKKWLQEYLSIQPIPSPSLKIEKQDLSMPLLKNEKCREICEEFGQTTERITDLKREISKYLNILKNINNGIYSDTLCKQSSLVNAEADQNKFENLFRRYKQLASEVSQLNREVISETEVVTDERVEKINKCIEELKNLHTAISGLKQPLSLLNKYLPSNDRIALSELLESVNKIKTSLQASQSDSSNDIEHRKQAQNNVSKWMDKARDAAVSLEKKFLLVLVLKKEIEKKLEEEMPIYLEKLQLANKAESVLVIESFHQQFLEQIKTSLSPEASEISLINQKEALDVLNTVTLSTLQKIRDLTEILERESQVGNEGEILQSKTFDLLIEQIQFFRSLITLSTDSPETFDSSEMVMFLQSLKMQLNKDVRRAIGSFKEQGGKKTKSGLSLLDGPVLTQSKKAIGGKIRQIEKSLGNEKDQIKDLLSKAEQDLAQARQKKIELIHSFLKHAVYIEGDTSNLEHQLDKAIDQARKLVIGLLQEYQFHSLDRFTKLLQAHRNFVIRLNSLLSNFDSNTADEIKEKLKLFLKSLTQEEFDDTKLITIANKPTELYRKMQGEHINAEEIALCNKIQKVVLDQFYLIFGAKITERHFLSQTGLQAAHVAPFSGLFSWQSDVLVHYLFESLFQEARSPTTVTKDLENFTKSIQEKGVADNAQIEKELTERGPKLPKETVTSVNELSSEYKQFLFEALIFLSRVSALEMSETEHFPNWFNQEMDGLTEKKYTEKFSESYKILLGDALLELIDMESGIIPPLAPLHITYLTNILTILEDRINKLLKQSEKLTVLELLECHALVSIFVGIQQLEIEDHKLESIQHLFQALENKIEREAT